MVCCGLLLGFEYRISDLEATSIPTVPQPRRQPKNCIRGLFIWTTVTAPPIFTLNAEALESLFPPQHEIHLLQLHLNVPHSICISQSPLWKDVARGWVGVWVWVGEIKATHLEIVVYQDTLRKVSHLSKSLVKTITLVSLTSCDVMRPL